jgi:hypothetical protein
MQIADLINGGFEIFGGFAMARNVRALYRAKRFEGVDMQASAFFTSWGLWNLWYYPNLGQWVSFVGGLTLVIANAFYIALMWRYRNNK